MSSPQDKRIRVCLLDDHLMVRAGLKMLLASEPTIRVIAEANDRREALDIARRERPDIFLVDIKLGEGMATDFLPELMASSKNTRAILLTSITDRDELCRAVRAGARGLVLQRGSAGSIDPGDPKGPFRRHLAASRVDGIGVIRGIGRQ